MSHHDDELPEHEPDEPQEPRGTGKWRPPLGTPEDRWKVDAYSRMTELDRMLYHLYTTSGVSDPNRYPIDPETLKPGWLGSPTTGSPSSERVTAG